MKLVLPNYIILKKLVILPPRREFVSRIFETAGDKEFSITVCTHLLLKTAQGASPSLESGNNIL